MLRLLVAVALAVLGLCATAQAAPLRLLSADAGTPLVADEGRSLLWQDGTAGVRLADAVGRIRRVGVPEGCRAVSGPEEGEALLACGTDGAPVVLDLDTGATSAVVRTGPTWPGPPDDFVEIGRAWLGGSFLCDSRFTRRCPVFLDRRTGERRAFGVDARAIRDLDDPGLRRVPRRPPSCRRLGRGSAYLRGGADGEPLVLVRCGRRPRRVALSRCVPACGARSISRGIATWTVGTTVFARNASTGRRARWAFPGRGAAGTGPAPTAVVVGAFVYVSVAEPPGLRGGGSGHLRLLRARTP